MTVLVTATGFTEDSAYETALTGSNITVVIATSSDPSSWNTNPPGTPPGYQGFLKAYHQLELPNDDLLDGYAIMHHDALAATAQAIRLAAQSTSTPAPTPKDIANQFGLLNLAYPVQGASGTLSFPSEQGRATGQPILIQQIK